MKYFFRYVLHNIDYPINKGILQSFIHHSLKISLSKGILIKITMLPYPIKKK